MRFSIFIVPLALLCTGCANHPDISDRTRHSTYDIIHKVRCEAAEQVWEHVESTRSAGIWHALRDGTKRKGELTRTVANIQSDKSSELLIGAQLVQDRTRTDRKRMWLQHQTKALEAAQKALNEVDSKNKLELQTLIRGTFDIDVALAKAREAEAAQTSARQNSERLSKVSAELAVLEQLFGTLGGAIQKANNRLDLADLREAKQQLKKLDQDLSALVKDGGALFQTSVAMQFRFDLTEQNKASTEGKVTFPIHFGSSSIGFDSALDKKRQSDRAVGMSTTFGELYDLYESKSCDTAGLTDPEHRRARVYPITGNVGMRELVDQYIKIRKDTTLAKSVLGDSKLFSDKIVFTTEVSGGVAPSIDLSPTPKHKISFGIDLSASRKDVHEVIVDIAPAKQAAPTPDATLNIGSLPEVGIRIVDDDYVLSPGPSLQSQ
jgi:hypothetical protein